MEPETYKEASHSGEGRVSGLGFGFQGWGYQVWILPGCGSELPVKDERLEQLN